MGLKELIEQKKKELEEPKTGLAALIERKKQEQAAAQGTELTPTPTPTPPNPAPPTTSESFNPEGTGYDMETALKYGLKPDPVTKHWQDTVKLPGEGDIRLVLKGTKYPNYNLTVEEEKKAGYEIFKGEDGRYYSRPVKGLAGLIQRKNAELKPTDSLDWFQKPQEPTNYQELLKNAPPQEPLPTKIARVGKEFIKEFSDMGISRDLANKQGVRALGTSELIGSLISDNEKKPLPPEFQRTKEQIDQSLIQAGETDYEKPAEPTQDIENLFLFGSSLAAPMYSAAEGLFMKVLGPRIGYAVSSAIGEGGLSAAIMGGLSAAEDISNAPPGSFDLSKAWDKGVMSFVEDAANVVDFKKAGQSAFTGGLWGGAGGLIGGLVFGAPIVTKMNMIRNITGQSGTEVAGRINRLAEARGASREAATDMWLGEILDGAREIQKKAQAAGVGIEDYAKQADEAVINATAKIDAMVGPMQFSQKIKLVAQKRNTSPQQINRLLQKEAQTRKTTRGAILDELFASDFPDAPVKVNPEKVTKDTIGEVLNNEVLNNEFYTPMGTAGVSQTTSRVGRNRAPLMPEGTAADFAARMADELDRNPKLDFSTLYQRPKNPTEAAAWVGGERAWNHTVMEDDEINRVLQIATQSSPEFQIKDLPTAISYHESRATAFGVGTLDKWLARFNINSRTSPEGTIRKAAEEMIAAESWLGQIANDVSGVARRMRAGESGLEGQYETLMLNMYKLLDKTTGVRSEWGRMGAILKSRRAHDPIALQRAFMNDVKKFVGKDALSEDIIKRIAQIDILDPISRQKFLNSLYHPSLRNYVDELWYNGLLSSPKTQVRNILGNIGANIIREIERPIAGAADYVISVGGYRRPQERFVGESKYAIAGFGQGWVEGTRAGIATWKNEISQFGITSTKLDVAGVMAPAFKGRFGRYLRYPSKALFAMDDFFKALNYNMEKNALAYREAVKWAKRSNISSDIISDVIQSKYRELVANPPEELITKAMEEARLRTFTTSSGEISKGLIYLRNKAPAMEFLVPFLRTPLNIAEFGIDRMPILNILSLINRKRQGLPINVSEEIAKNVIGLSTVTSVALINKYGSPEEGIERITGQEVDPKKRTEEKIFLGTGQQKYAINAFGKSISYFNFEPASTILGMATDYVDLWNNAEFPISGWEFWATAMLKIPGQNITGKTFADGFETFFAAFQGDIYRVKKNLYRTAASFMPIGASSIARGISQAFDLDPETRSPMIRETDTLMDALKGNLGMRNDLLPVFDAWGRQLSTEGGLIHRMLKEINSPFADTAGGVIDAIADPTIIKELSNDPVNKEVWRIMKALPPGEGFPTFDTPDDMIKYVGQIPREQYIEYVQRSGQLSYKRVQNLMNSQFYDSLPLLKKRDLIAKVRTQAREDTKKQMFGSMIKTEKREYKQSNYGPGAPR